MSPDRVVPELDISLVQAGSPPSWFTASLAAIRIAEADPIFSTQSLWDAITTWDTNNPEHTFFGSDEYSNKVELAAFLGNVAQETGDLKFAKELDKETGEPCNVEQGTCGTSTVSTSVEALFK